MVKQHKEMKYYTVEEIKEAISGLSEMHRQDLFEWFVLEMHKPRDVPYFGRTWQQFNKHRIVDIGEDNRRRFERRDGSSTV